MQYTDEQPELHIPRPDDNPLRVTIMFQDGSVFTYYEQRDALPDSGPIIGNWRAPFPKGNLFMAYGIVESFRQGELRAMLTELGDIVAVSTQPRAEASDGFTCGNCQGLGDEPDKAEMCERCNGTGKEPWR